ncbi:DEAD/DEAH box helicase [Gordonibacter sp.]|uniref:DEAD/DEAH box helicase n=1 Tax=Gordonibacter sp. TaxID=1968902 RepID=UPI002FC89EB8
MLSEDEISRHCHERTLQRARQIAASDRNILTKQVHYSRTETTVKAFVASSHGWDDRYRTSVTFDEDSGEITDYACTCPAFYESDGMCKHGAALALAYLDAPERFMGYQAKRVAATSPGIAALMKREREAAEAVDRESIDLETVIEYGYRSWSAHFRLVGESGSYVLRNITDFVHRMRTGAFFSYGKKLSFAHSPLLLSDHGRAVARFLDKAVSLREQVGGSTFLRYRGRDEVERDLSLTDSEIIELLDALTGTLFTVRGTDYGTRSVTQAYVVDEDPSIAIRIGRSGLDGYDIEVPEETPFAAQGDRMYAWQGDRFYRCSSTFARTADFLRSLYESEEGSLFVSEADMPLFCATVLPAIEQLLQVSAPPEIDAYRPVACKLEFYFDKNKQGVTCDAQAVYGQRRYQLFTAGEDKTTASNDASPIGPLRDDPLENRARRLIEEYFDLPVPFIEISDDATIAELVFGGLARFQALGTAFTTPAFDRLLTDKQPRLTTGLSLAGNLVNLTISAEDLPASEVAALLSSYRKRKRYHRLRNGAFMSLEGYDLAQLDRIVADFGITAKQLSTGVVELPAYQAFYLDEQLNDTSRDESFTRYLENFRSVDEHAYRVPAALEGTLRPYQEEGFRWMSALADAGFGGILADEMGLGKSVQLISFLLARQNDARALGPSLIVCPASLVYNWLAEFERFAPELSARAVTGTKRERELIRTEAFGEVLALSDKHGAEGQGGPSAGCCDVLVTSYDLARIDADAYAECTFFCCALDEAQYVKNHATKTARGIKRIQARHRFALTGTPVENRPSELWSIFDFLLPGLLGSYMRFRERFELDILGGSEDAAARLRTLVGPFVLRRLKDEVLRDLPEKLESVVRVHLEGEQQRLYAASEQQLREALTRQRRERKNKRLGSELPPVEILAELTKLRQLCCDPHLLYENYEGSAAKLDAVMELVESARDGGEKSLVFSQFTSFLARIADRLDQQGVPYYTITGATPKKKRLDLVNTFNEDDTPVFLVSLKAGGTGLNLTGASVVIHADPWWNAAAQNQATDRAHRIGQDKLVSVHRVIAAGTIEERIVRLQEAKSQLADQIVGGNGISLSTLSREDLLELLEG